jgi:molybdopterin synthase catalytic subunit
MVNSLGSNQRFYDNHPRHMSIESVSGAVASFGGTVKEIRAEPHNVEKATVDQFSELVKKAKLSKDIKKTLTKLFAENYVLDIVPGT